MNTYESLNGWHDGCRWTFFFLRMIELADKNTLKIEFENTSPEKSITFIQSHYTSLLIHVELIDNASIMEPNPVRRTPTTQGTCCDPWNQRKRSHDETIFGYWYRYPAPSFSLSPQHVGPLIFTSRATSVWWRMLSKHAFEWLQISNNPLWSLLANAENQNPKPASKGWLQWLQSGSYRCRKYLNPNENWCFGKKFKVVVHKPFRSGYIRTRLKERLWLGQV